MGIFGSLFGSGKNQIHEYLEKGAVIVDVRTPAEYKSGHIQGSKNYPLQQLVSHIKTIKNFNKPVVLCCASGMRSGQAASILKKEGLDCINGGGWNAVESAMMAST